MERAWSSQEYGTQARYYIGRAVGSHLRGFCIVDPEGRGAARPRGAGAAAYDWLRRANDEPDREERRAVAARTSEAVEARGYIFKGRKTVPLRHVSACKEGTRIISPTVGAWVEDPGRVSASGALAPKPEWKAATALAVARSVVFAEAAEQLKAGHRVVAVNAASAYHSGGGFASGGRHALEEAMCVQSSLYPSLRLLEEIAGPQGFGVVPWAQPPSRRDGSSWRCHIPNDGAVLSPSVEMFRSGSDSGYAFAENADLLSAVVSVAMPNCNDRMSDSPVDCHLEPRGYRAQLEQKWRAVLLAAADFTDADCLVVPDAGCGVFRNPPGAVGDAFGTVLRQEFAGRFAKVVIAFPGGPAGEEFASSARAAFEGRPSPLGSHPSTPLAGPPAAAAANFAMNQPASGGVIWEFSVSAGFEAFDAAASAAAEAAYLRFVQGGSSTGYVPSRGKTIVLDFVQMTQHIQGFNGRTRTLRRRIC